MKKYYIGRTGESPIAGYSKDFYELVLRDEGYIFLDSDEHHVEILSKAASRDQVHIEIDGSHPKANHLLYLMLKTGYHHVSVTLHDALSARLSLGKHKNPVVDCLNRFYRTISHSNAADDLFSRIKMIYVLSRNHVEPVKKKYRMDNVCYLPYVLTQQEIERLSYDHNGLIISGQGGKEKEIAYYRRLHRQLMEHDANVNLFLRGREADEDPGFWTKRSRVKSSSPANGIYPGGPVQKDVQIVRSFPANAGLLDRIRKDKYKYLMDNYSPEAVRKHYKD